MENALSFESFRNQVESYLLPDLETMLAAEGSGGCGYPMVQTILSAMELVGMLLSGHPESGGFDAFFSEFTADHPEYARARKVLYRAMRHSTAHLYLLHIGIAVTKNGCGNLTRRASGHLNIDLRTLHDDFLQTYERLMAEVEGGREVHGLGAVLKKLSNVEKDVTELAEDLPPYPEPSTPLELLAGGTDLAGGTISFPLIYGASATDVKLPPEG
jgi:hypothetical protein